MQFSRSCVVSIFVAAAALAAGQPTVPAPVPAAYQDMVNQLTQSLDSFAKSMSTSGQSPRYPTTFSAGLSSANANMGPSVSSPQQYAVILQELNSLQALGVRGVTVNVSFPMLYAPFYSDPSAYAQSVDFYTRLATDIRARGLKVIVESSALFSQNGSTGWNLPAFYQSLSWSQYQSGRMQTVQAIARVMRPDYLSVIGEPDTEADQTGFAQVNTVSGAGAMVNLMLAGIQQTGIQGIVTGAGVGSWHPQYRQFVQSFLSTSVRFINIHIYPVNFDFLQRAITIADMAASVGKSVGIGQAWLSKMRDSECGVISTDAAFARDTYSFWSGLDGYFLQSLVQFANVKRALFISPFWSRYFHAYLTYVEADETLPSAQIQSMASSQAGANMVAGAWTGTAVAYGHFIVSPADATPPMAPAVVTATPNSTSAIALNWNPATDNVGVAGYTVYRNGVSVGTSAQPPFTDRGLAPGTKYSYVISAYDLAGNVSAPSAMAVATTMGTPKN